jgi:Na+-driven multidrug efflux pump
MRAVGPVVIPLFIASFSLLAVRFPLAEALVRRWEADAIWWSFPISAAFDLTLAALYYKFGGWQTTSIDSRIPSRTGNEISL